MCLHNVNRMDSHQIHAVLRKIYSLGSQMPLGNYQSKIKHIRPSSTHFDEELQLNLAMPFRDAFSKAINLREQ